jgi:hypothetical protein
VVKRCLWHWPCWMRVLCHQFSSQRERTPSERGEWRPTDRAVYGPSREAVLGPTFTSGDGNERPACIAGPFTGLPTPSASAAAGWLKPPIRNARERAKSPRRIEVTLAGSRDPA